VRAGKHHPPSICTLWQKHARSHTLSTRVLVRAASTSVTRGAFSVRDSSGVGRCYGRAGSEYCTLPDRGFASVELSRPRLTLETSSVESS
jgi:hypothetical protein